MFYFLILLSILLGSLLYNGSYIYFAFFLLLDLYLIFFRLKNKKYLIISIFLVVLLYITSYIYDSINLNINTFIVLERKEKYVIIFNGIKKYYLKVDSSSTLDFLDIIKIDSFALSKIDFATLESGFDFNTYLKGKNVLYQLESSSISVSFDFFINPFSLKSNYLNIFQNEEARNLISGLLFGMLSYKNESTLILKELSIFNLFSVSGIYLNFCLYKIKDIFYLKLKEKTSYILSFLVFFPFLFININKFSVIKAISFYIFNFLNKFYIKNKFERIEVISLLGSLFLLINFRIIYQSGFYISFVFYYFLLFFSSKINDFRKIKKFMMNYLYLSLLMLPFSIYFNNSINLISYILSILFMPISKILFVCGLFSLTISSNLILEKILTFIINIFSFLDKFSLTINIPPFNEILFIFYYLLIFFIFYYYEIGLKMIYQKLNLALVMFLTIYFLPINNLFSYEVSFINIGQGDSTLIRYKNEAYLIDTGGLTYSDVGVNNIIPYLKKERIYSLNSIFITHYDYDHSGALNSLINNFNVKNVYDYNNFDEYNGSLSIKNLNIYGVKYTDENDKSLVLYLNLNNKYFLFMGDASTSIEKEIMENYETLSCDYLKVGHHGSKTSSSLEFLKFVNPKEAIISCGKNNRYKHPHDITIKNLTSLNIKIRRTDVEGTIKYKFYSF